jgi:hypothetical protein
MKEGTLSEYSSMPYRNSGFIKTVMEPNTLGLSAFRNLQMVSEVCILFTINPMRASNRMSVPYVGLQ